MNAAQSRQCCMIYVAFSWWKQKSKNLKIFLGGGGKIFFKIGGKFERSCPVCFKISYLDSNKKIKLWKN